MVFVGIVENLYSKHNETRIMSTSQANVIQIVKPETELRTNQRVGRRVKLACHAVGLKAKDAGSNKINVITPPSDNWVALN